MALGDLSRIGTNVQSLDAYRQLSKTNNDIGLRQMRLATGSRLNRAEDDAASYTIATKLEARTRGQAQALSNIGDAKSMLTVAEGSMGTIMDILQTMKEKAVQSANDTMGTAERADIRSAITALRTEIGDILDDTTFNGVAMFSGSANTSFTFQVNAENGDTMSVSISSISNDNLGVTTTAIAAMTNSSGAQTFLSTIDSAIATVADRLGDLGDSQSRLTFKQDQLSVSMNNYDAARSRIADADFAKEQMEIAKLQIMQQTGISSFAQANSAPQAVLSLL